MILSVLQIAAVTFIALYFAWLRLRARIRNHQSWESLLAKLRRGWNACELSEHFPWKEGLSASPEQIWARMRGVRGLWAMYRNAGTMLELADFAARHAGVDPELLTTLRSDATQIRLCVLKALAEWALNNADESVRISAFRVASMYTGMAARMTEFLQGNAEVALPSFVAAM